MSFARPGTLLTTKLSPQLKPKYIMKYNINTQLSKVEYCSTKALEVTLSPLLHKAQQKFLKGSSTFEPPHKKNHHKQVTNTGTDTIHYPLKTYPKIKKKQTNNIIQEQPPSTPIKLKPEPKPVDGG